MVNQKPQREQRLILDGSFCQIDYFNRSILTVEHVLITGFSQCARYAQCRSQSTVYCALKEGEQVAKYVTKGASLKNELYDYFNAVLSPGKWGVGKEFIDTSDRREFVMVSGKGKILKAVEYAARSVLLENLQESCFPECERCNGIVLEKEVIDSIHDCPGIPLAGSGRTKKRLVKYCPDCDPEPRGGIIDVNPLDEIADEIRQARRLDNK